MVVCMMAAITIQVNNKDAPEINPVCSSLEGDVPVKPTDPTPYCNNKGLTWILRLFWFDVGFILFYNRVKPLWTDI